MLGGGQRSGHEGLTINRQWCRIDGVLNEMPGLDRKCPPRTLRTSCGRPVACRVGGSTAERSKPVGWDSAAYPA
jgi:hypothetical protein